MIDQVQEHHNAVTSFRNALPFAFRADNFQGNISAVKNNIRWEAAILQMFEGMKLYAEIHKRTYESTVGYDGFFSPIFESICNNLKELMNGEHGRLDACEFLKSLKQFAHENDLNLDYDI